MGLRWLTLYICDLASAMTWLSTAVVFRLFPKPVNLPQKPVGYRLTFIQYSDISFSWTHKFTSVEPPMCLCIGQVTFCCTDMSVFLHYLCCPNVLTTSLLVGAGEVAVSGTGAGTSSPGRTRSYGWVTGFLWSQQCFDEFVCLSSHWR